VSDDDATIVEFVRGIDGRSSMRHGLNAEQFVARACLVCLGVVDARLVTGPNPYWLPALCGSGQVLGGTR